MKAVISPSRLRGRICVPASKSQAHRLLICAAFADGPTDVFCRELSEDIAATAGCLRAMGCGIDYDGAVGVFHVVPYVQSLSQVTMDAGESGATLRFLLPLLCALGRNARVVMRGRLSERPLSPLWEELEAHGAKLKRCADGSLEISGILSGSCFTLAADVSSQFISGLLFALPLMEGSSSEVRQIRLTGSIESEGYLRMTLDVLRQFGVGAEWRGDTITVPADAAYRSPGTAAVEGDWSNGAFWICASAMSGDTLEITGLDPASSQGDSAVTALKDLIINGAKLPGAPRTAGQTNRGTIVIDARHVPDLVPVLSVLAASVQGETVFTHAGRLRFKESDRLKTTADMLRALGGDAAETTDGLRIRGTGGLRGGTADSAGDHRIAMSAAVASVICEENVTVLNAQAVKKSYPGFWKDLEDLGGRVRMEAD